MNGVRCLYNLVSVTFIKGESSRNAHQVFLFSKAAYQVGIQTFMSCTIRGLALDEPSNLTIQINAAYMYIYIYIIYIHTLPPFSFPRSKNSRFSHLKQEYKSMWACLNKFIYIHYLPSVRFSDSLSLHAKIKPIYFPFCLTPLKSIQSNLYRHF